MRMDKYISVCMYALYISHTFQTTSNTLSIGAMALNELTAVVVHRFKQPRYPTWFYFIIVCMNVRQRQIEIDGYVKACTQYAYSHTLSYACKADSWACAYPFHRFSLASNQRAHMRTTPVRQYVSHICLSFLHLSFCLRFCSEQRACVCVCVCTLVRKGELHTWRTNVRSDGIIHNTLYTKHFVPRCFFVNSFVSSLIFFSVSLFVLTHSCMLDFVRMRAK